MQNLFQDHNSYLPKMSSQNKENPSKVENPGSGAAKSSFPYPGGGKGNNEENEMLEMSSHPLINEANCEANQSSENGERNISETSVASGSELKHRLSSNTVDRHGVTDDEVLNREKCMTSNNENLYTASPSKYNKLCSEDPTGILPTISSAHTHLPSDSDRLLPSTLNEDTSNIQGIPKDGLLCSNQTPSKVSKNVLTSSESVRFLEEKNLTYDISPNSKTKDKKGKSEILSVDFDALLLQIGEMGRYQLGLYLLMCVPATLPAAFLAFNQVFLSATPTHWCRIPYLYEYNNVGFKNDGDKLSSHQSSPLLYLRNRGKGTK